MKSFSKVLGCIVLIVGSIGSIVCAALGGIETTTYYTFRNWGTTLGIFAGCFLSIAILAVLLFGLAEVLENQEVIKKNQTEIKQIVQDKK